MRFLSFPFENSRLQPIAKMLPCDEIPALRRVVSNGKRRRVDVQGKCPTNACVTRCDVPTNGAIVEAEFV
jgi:hypothetical protein